MPPLQTILTRMISNPVFAEAVFTNAAYALAEYQLSNEELAKFRAMPRAEFEALTHGFRKLLLVMAPEIAPPVATVASQSLPLFEP